MATPGRVSELALFPMYLLPLPICDEVHYKLLWAGAKVCIKTDHAISILCWRFHTMKSGCLYSWVGDTLPETLHL